MFTSWLKMPDAPSSQRSRSAPPVEWGLVVEWACRSAAAATTGRRRCRSAAAAGRMGRPAGRDGRDGTDGVIGSDGIGGRDGRDYYYYG